MSLLVVTAVLAFLFGAITGAALVARNTHRLVARLDPLTRVEFARKVNAAARR